ncbi:type IX secretion system membrane protein, PorP/SprF family [Ekhidna lutea]|uniref:Type IX secretion system membrane protein, PorP/SprF family n=1 Tax=Ekhidna lutea TaxID=447679 RepID=A0A239HBU1_EKHLU|nr:type IX secretion system membrane protein PorP/SprF [Ekhidna lutea]SNS78488.1 type IX secretion system membrane protein, PorP/SprF family [Ekhidna lutea]
MMKVKLYIAILLTSFCIAAQDAQYSQFYSNPLYLNPAFAGTSPNTRAVFVHRIQWPNLPQAFSNSTASIDYNATNLNSGFGLIISSDSEGSGGLRNTTGSFVYSYEANMNNKFILRPALKFGYTVRNIDRSKLVLGDQVDFGVDGTPSQDPQVNSIRLRNHWDIGAGFLIYSKKSWFGMSVDHLTKPNRSMIEGKDILPFRYSFHIGSRYPLKRLVSTGTVAPSIAPSILYRKQGEFQQLDAGASVHLQPIIIGLYYRGMPFIKNDYDRVNHDAVIIVAGVEYNNLEFGYSFDLNMTKIDPVTGGGAHEFSLIYYFSMAGNPHKTRNNQKKLQCPAFVKKLNN